MRQLTRRPENHGHRDGSGLPRLAGSERGFTLAELLVALTLTLIVLTGAVTALQDANRASQAGTALIDVNQNLRVGMNLLIRDLLQTGQGIPTGGIPLPSGAGAFEILRPGPDDALTFPDDWTTLPAISPGPALGAVVGGVATDLVTLLIADPLLVLNTEPLASISADGSIIEVADALPIDDVAVGIFPGDLVMLTNGHGNALQEVTEVDGQTVTFGEDAFSGLNQPDAPEGSVLQLRNDDGTWPPTTVTRIQMVTYFVTVDGAGVPRLFRRLNYGDARLIAVGIENLQISYDLVDGVTNPTNVKAPEAPNTPHQIRKANLFAMARALTDGAEIGRHVRASLATQVSLRSLAFVDRYQ